MDRDLCVVSYRTKTQTTSKVNWDLKNKKVKGLIRLCLANSMLPNVHGEKSSKDLQKNLRDVYQVKYLVRKLFLKKKLYSLKMEGGFVANHLNAFNRIIAQLSSIGDKIENDDRCMLMLCCLPNSRDHLMMAIESTTAKFKMVEVVPSLLSEEMQRKSPEMAKEALATCGRFKKKARRITIKKRSKSLKRSKSHGKSKVKCCNCGKSGHIYKEYKKKNKKRGKNNISD